MIINCTFTATGNKVFIVSSKTGVDGVEALGYTLVLPHQHPVLQVPQVHSLQRLQQDSMSHWLLKFSKCEYVG